MENSLDKLVKAISKASKINDGSIEDERRQNAVTTAADAARKRIDYHCAVALRVDNWLPACNGTETPFIARSGKRMMYCWNPATDQHAYLDLNCDMILSNEEAQIALGI